MVTMSADPIFIDTNVLTRATITSAPLHTEAQAALLRLRHEGRDLWISHQVIREYAANASRPQAYSQPIPAIQLLEQIRRFRATFRVAQDTTVVLDHLLTLIHDVPMGGKQLHDANIVATMLANGIRDLFTHNIIDFVRFSAYIVVVPLESAPTD